MNESSVHADTASEQVTKPWRPWARHRRLSDAQLMAAVHTRWWWIPAVARRYAQEDDRD
jgi:hypothetical protein